MRGGIGRFKPDIVTYATNLMGYVNGKCMTSSGTSVATPIVAAAIALIYEEGLTPGYIKQAIIKAADRLDEYGIFEQGAGKLNVAQTLAYLSLEKTIVAFPEYWSNHEMYFHPYDLQGMYYGASVVIVNFTVFHPDLAAASLELVNLNQTEPNLNINLEISDFSAYTASVGVFLSLKSEHSGYINATIYLKSELLTCKINLSLKTSQTPERRLRLL